MEPVYVDEERIFIKKYGTDLRTYVDNHGGIEFAKKQLKYYALEERANEEVRLAKMSPIEIVLEREISKRLEDALVFSTGKSLKDTSPFIPFCYSVMSRIAKRQPAFITSKQAKALQKKYDEAKSERAKKDKDWREALMKIQRGGGSEKE